MTTERTDELQTWGDASALFDKAVNDGGMVAVAWVQSQSDGSVRFVYMGHDYGREQLQGYLEKLADPPAGSLN